MVVRRVSRLFSAPDEAAAWLKRCLGSAWLRLRTGHFREALDSLIGLTVGWETYIDYLVEKHDGGPVRRRIMGNVMYLDIANPGLPRSLFIHGIREVDSTGQFRSALRRLKDRTAGPVVVLEIGANVGYYALMEASVLGDRAAIAAYEPGPDNFEQLSRNVAANGFEDDVRLHQAAVGRTDTTADLQLTERSNTHKMRTGTGSDHADTVDTIPVDVRSVETVLAENDLEADAVNVVRMDVEGYEGEIFEGLDPILDGDQPLVVFVEVHNDRLTDDELDSILSRLEESGCEIRSVVSGEGTVAVDSYDALRELTMFELIVTR